MSIPTKETTFGRIKYLGETYRLFQRPLNDEQREQLQSYQKAHKCGYSSAPWQWNVYEWEIIDSKLYFTNLNFALCKDEEISALKEIFGTEPVFCDWFSGVITALVRKTEEKPIDEDEVECKREVLYFRFKNGVFLKTRAAVESYTKRVLKNYIEE